MKRERQLAGLISRIWTCAGYLILTVSAVGAVILLVPA